MKCIFCNQDMLNENKLHQAYVLLLNIQVLTDDIIRDMETNYDYEDKREAVKLMNVLNEIKNRINNYFR